MEPSYDVVIVGTGLSESILGCVLATLGYRILHLDQNPYYGGESASLNLEQLFDKFGKSVAESCLARDNSNSYSLDLVPKVLLAASDLFQLMERTIVQKYDIQFDVLEASFMMRDGTFHKVPSSEIEALSSGLMGFFEKRRAAKFFSFCDKYDPACETMTYESKPMSEIFTHFGLSDKTAQFVGHAVALHSNDEYLKNAAAETIQRCKLYNHSLQMCGESPYIYPHFGVGELPAFFARLGAVNGGTYCLDTELNEILFQNESFSGVKFSIRQLNGDKSEYSVQAKWLIAHPTYVPQFTDCKMEILRCICLSERSVSSVDDEYESFQLIIPGAELKRQNDVFVLQLSHQQKVVPEGRFAIYISTVMEIKESPETLASMLCGLLNCEPLEKFVFAQPFAQSILHGMSNMHVTNSLDATSHFQCIVEDVEKCLELIHSKPISEIYSQIKRS